MTPSRIHDSNREEEEKKPSLRIAEPSKGFVWAIGELGLARET